MQDLPPRWDDLLPSSLDLHALAMMWLAVLQLVRGGDTADDSDGGGGGGRSA